ncbi:MAG: VWA domain-containing protein, partial [Defluviitaleaceae bacterium]|nr:VWA domain-containing protein [Defluviitaleaceae bacterium]
MKVKTLLTTMAFVMVFFVCPSPAFASDATDVIFIVEISEAMREADPDREVLAAIAQFVGGVDVDANIGVGVVGFSAQATSWPFARLNTTELIATMRSVILNIDYHGENADIAPALQIAANMLATAHNPIVFVITSDNRQTSYPSMHVPVHSIIVNAETNTRGLAGIFSSIFNTHHASFVTAVPEPTPTPAPTPPPPTPTPPPDEDPDLDTDDDAEEPEASPEEIQIPPIHEWPEDYFDNLPVEIPEEDEPYDDI